MKKNRIWTGLTSLFVFLLIISIIGTTTALNYEGTINSILGISTSKLISEGTEEEIIAYESSYGELNGDNLKKLLEDAYEQSISEAEEGNVLLKNDNEALPLASSELNVTLFGHAVVQPLYRNHSAGSSSYEGEEGVDLYEALKDAGVNINETLYTAYMNSETLRGAGGFNLGTGEALPWSLGEEDISFYTDEVKASWENDNNDVAIVMLAREGGEGTELYMEDPAEGISQLALHQEEKDLLRMIDESGKFNKTIVLLNSGNAMEVDWLDEYNVDACIWIGCPGQKGFVGLVNILLGEANPSGKLTDTYSVNSLSAPACVNNSYNNQTWTNLDEVLKKSTDKDGEASFYAVQAEGIYIGYKYYETRYEDSILGRYNANGKVGSSTDSGWNYVDEVSYPFGYGLSYTTFEQTLDKVNVSGDIVTVEVTVKNTGATAGKSVVQIYAQTPYGDYEIENLVEKSAIQLLDFGKTGLLKPGESETLSIVCDKYLLASYDYKKTKGYIMSEGDYFVSIGDNAHDALNNVLAAKGVSGLVDITGSLVSGSAEKAYKWTENFDGSKYKLSSATGVVVTNQFDNCDINYWREGTVKYLTRSDWEGTYPKESTQVECSDEMISILNGYVYEKPEDAPSADDFMQSDQGITLATMAGVNYDDPLWDIYLNQLTVSTLASLLPDMCGNVEIPHVGKPANLVGDGPDGLGGLQAGYDITEYGFKAEPVCYTSENVLASTFNKDLIASRGSLLAEEALFMGLMEIWGPGGNLHRTPFNGRNFEYYSEDANMNYLCEIPEVAAIEAKGIISGIKHCASNDQENNRIGVACFFTEQAFREGGLRGFEGAIAVADASSAMQGFNRLGLIGCSASKALTTSVLRNEWGLQGIIITDASAGATEGYRANYIDQLVAGTDTWCIDFSDESAKAVKSWIKATDDGYLLQELRRAAKNIFYCTANSSAMNGYSSGSKVVSITPWWQPVLYAVIAVFSLLTVLSLIILIISKIKGKKQGNKEEAK